MPLCLNEKTLNKIKEAYSNKKSPSEADMKKIKEIFYYPNQYIELNILYANDMEVQEIIEEPDIFFQ